MKIHALAMTGLLSFPLVAPAATFVVDNVNDSGTGTWRDAIINANVTPGSDLIVFNISTGMVQTIMLQSPLPAIGESVVIDGYTEPGASPNTLTNGNNAVILIELNGTGLNNGSGLDLKTSGCLIRGLVINNFLSSGAATDGSAIFIEGGTNNVVEGCYLGTDVNGGAIAANMHGVQIAGGTGNRIGTDGDGVSDAGERNLISGNVNAGVLLAGATGNLIAGNFIGTDASGSASVPNDSDGVALGAGATGNTLTDNLISGNVGNGIVIADAGNLIAANRIGTDLSATQPLPNNLAGIIIAAGDNNTVGGPGAGNVIAFNNDAGVRIRNGTGNAVLGNSIFGNLALGINLGDDAVTPNDPGDADVGPNNLQNFPVLTFAGVNGAATTITGILNSEPNRSYRVELFDNPQCDGSGFGQGQTFLGSTVVMTDATGSGSFNVTLPVAVNVGDAVTATATDPANNTSEFSACVPVVAVVCATDITPFVQLRHGNITGNVRSGSCRQRVTVTNTSGQTLNTSVYLALDNLPAGVTLANATGATMCAAPLGSPVILVTEVAFPPGQKVKVQLNFANPKRKCIKYTPRVLAGPGTP